MSMITIDIDSIVADTDLSSVSTLFKALSNSTPSGTMVDFVERKRSIAKLTLGQVDSFWAALVNRSDPKKPTTVSVSIYGVKYRMFNSIMFLIDIIINEHGDMNKITDYISDVTSSSSGFRLYPMPE